MKLQLIFSRTCNVRKYDSSVKDHVSSLVVQLEQDWIRAPKIKL